MLPFSGIDRVVFVSAIVKKKTAIAIAVLCFTLVAVLFIPVGTPSRPFLLGAEHQHFVIIPTKDGNNKRGDIFRSKHTVAELAKIVKPYVVGWKRDGDERHFAAYDSPKGESIVFSRPNASSLTPTVVELWTPATWRDRLSLFIARKLNRR